MLHANAVSFEYGAHAVLRDVSIAVPPGGLVGVLGPNGSGKTTLLRVLAGLLTPSSGQVSLGGERLVAFSRRALATRMAMVPQETQLAFDYDVLEVVLMGRYPHLKAFQIEGSEDLGYARQALHATGTTHLSDRGFATLSGGEKQRVVIASALAQLSSDGNSTNQPQILLLDEPTASLDLRYQLEVSRLVRSLNHRGITIIVSTHDLNFAARVCRDLVLLRQGEVLAAGPTEDVLNEAAVAQLFGVDVHVGYNETAGHRLVVPIADTSEPVTDQ